MDQIAEFRAFNRFYTGVIGALDTGHLDTRFSLSEARLIYEVATRGRCSAAEIARSMAIDPGRLSRLVARLRDDGTLNLEPSARDRRQLDITLTEAGREAFAVLDAATIARVEELLGGLEAPRRNAVVAAMSGIRAGLGDAMPAAPLLIRPHRIGDVAHTVSRQSALYAEEYGFDASYEALAMEIGAKFLRDFDPARECCFIAERRGEIVGAVFLVNAGDGVGQLRLLYVEPSARGLGIGTTLVGECVRFARAKGYRRMRLWTQSILIAARKIYAAHGFTLVESAPKPGFGKDLIGEFWERAL